MTDVTAIILAIAYGAAMKLADLTNEHGKRWFFADAWVFGLGWGGAGALLMAHYSSVGVILLAQLAAYGLRGSLDYWNHRVAALVMVATYLFLEPHRAPTFSGATFFIFLLVFTIFGSLRDFFGNKYQKRDWRYKLNEPAWYYYVPTLIFSFATGEWIVFWVFAAYRTSYNVVKYLAKDF